MTQLVIVQREIESNSIESKTNEELLVNPIIPVGWDEIWRKHIYKQIKYVFEKHLNNISNNSDECT